MALTDANKKTLRTVLQTAVGVAAVLPLVVEAADIPETLPWVAAMLAVSGAVTRVMALDAVQRLLPKWLRTDMNASE